MTTGRPEKMPLIDDREIILGFCEESEALLEQLEDVLEELEDNLDPSLLEQFGQIIDRMMGAAKSIGATDIGIYCELGKVIGYKSSQSNDQKLLKIVVPILLDAVEILRGMVKSLATNNTTAVTEVNTAAFAERLSWLSTKFKNIERASVSYQKESETPAAEIDDLMKQLGL